MHLGMLLEMAADGLGDRVMLGHQGSGRSMAELATMVRRAGAWLAAQPGERVVLADLNSEAVPLTLLACALANKPFVPVNYRLTDEQLQAIVARTAPSTVIVGPGVAERLGTIDGVHLVTRDDLLAAAAADGADEASGWVGSPAAMRDGVGNTDDLRPLGSLSRASTSAALVRSSGSPIGMSMPTTARSGATASCRCGSREATSTSAGNA